MKQRKGRLWRHIKSKNSTNDLLRGGFWTIRSRRFFRDRISLNVSISVMYMRFFQEYRPKRLREGWKQAYSWHARLDKGKDWNCYWNGSGE